MNSRFDTLCRTLNLNSEAPSEEALAELAKWFFLEVSQDKYTPVRLEAARDYLDVFLPNVPDNLAAPIPALQNLNAVQYAATHGYDRFIEKLDSSKSALLNKGIKNSGMTPLHLAASYGHVQSVEVLLKHGASPLSKNSVNEYPIHSALFTPVIVDKKFHKRKELIFNAIKKTAPDTCTAKDATGETVAHKMAAHGYEALLATLIRENPELILLPDNFMKYPISLAILNNQPRIVQLLLAVKGVANLADSDNRVALHYAARSNNQAILQICLSYYPNVDIRDTLNKTPLLFAAEAGRLSALITLIEHGADVRAMDSMGLNILHHAVNSANISLVRWIVNNVSLDLNTPDHRGNSALTYAKQRGLADIEELLAEQVPKLSLK